MRRDACPGNPAPPPRHNGRMSDFYDEEEEIRSADLCPSCYEIPLVGEVGEEVECPNCGHVVIISR